MAQLINGSVPVEDARAALAAAFDLKYTRAVQKMTARLYDRVKAHVPEVEWAFHAPLIVEINRLKKKKDVLLLAHHYQSPQIYHGVADVVGDTLQLALAAQAAKQAVIVQCGVHFMAEISKLLSPKKTVLIPDSRAGCSIAAAITPEDVLAMRAQYPGAPVIAYVNSSAAVKAVSDVCCTAGNALEIVERVPGDSVILIPDQHLARNIAKRSLKKIITWAGSCEVHESFTASDIAELRHAYPDARIIAHPECPPEVIAVVDYAGSTMGMIDYLKAQKPRRVVMVTECGMSDNIAPEAPDTEFLRGCNLCPHMKRITLENILFSLHTMTEEVVIDPTIAGPARAALERMIACSNKGD
jgi:quinolinate synthase